MLLKSLILLFVFSLPVYAESFEIPEEPTNFCLDKQNALDNEEIARKNPYDEDIIKVVALRTGLCDLLDKGLIELDFAITLFNETHSMILMKRIQKERTANEEIGA